MWTLPLDQSDKAELARDKRPSQHSSKGHWVSQASPPHQGENPCYVSFELRPQVTSMCNVYMYSTSIVRSLWRCYCP